MAPRRDAPALTRHCTIRGVDYTTFLARFNDSAAVHACNATAGDMAGLHVSAWDTDLDALPPPSPGAPPPPSPPPPDVTQTYVRRMVFSPVIDEPWLPKLSMFQVNEVHTIEGRPGPRSPVRMTGAAHLRWASWAKPAHVLDSVILARPVEWAGGASTTPGVALELAVVPHLPPWAVGPIKRLVLAGIADMFKYFSTRSLACAAAAVGAQVIEGDAASAGAVEVEGEGEVGGKAAAAAAVEEAAGIAAEA